MMDLSQVEDAMAAHRWPDGDGAVGNHGTVTADRSSFDDLYQREWSGLVALGWTLTGNWQTAEELVQDAFADAYARWPEVADMDRPGAWVRRAVVNRSASVHRSRSAERRANDRWGTRSRVDAETPSSDATGDRAMDRVSDPEFWAAVRALPERQAAAVALHYLEDLPVAEIAEILGCRPATVKVHLHRGRQALAQRLVDSTKNGDGQPVITGTTTKTATATTVTTKTTTAAGTAPTGLAGAAERDSEDGR